MVNWSNPTVFEEGARILGAIALVLVGVATWEVVVTFAFDWSIITGQRKWRWPMALYFLCRICLLLQIWTIAIHANAIGEVNCQVLNWLNKLSDAFGTCAASFILALRTYAVWGQDKRIGVGLAIFSIGQMVLWVYLTTFWTSSWDASHKACMPARNPDPWVYISTYAYTMVFDFLVLGLMTQKLLRHAGHGGMVAILLNDGVLYFIASVLANGIEVIFVAMQLNPIMNVIAIPWASVVSTIAATRLFRHAFEAFDELSSTKVVGTSGGFMSTIAFWSGGPQTLDTQTNAGRTGGVIVHTKIDVERDAESETGKASPRPISHDSEQFEQGEIDALKIHRL